jgi:hypothetical protein
MSILINGDVNDILVTTIHSDPKLGIWFAIGTEKEWFEIRVTKAGKFRVGTPKKEKHPYFTINNLTPIGDK